MATSVEDYEHVSMSPVVQLLMVLLPVSLPPLLIAYVNGMIKAATSIDPLEKDIGTFFNGTASF